MCRYVEKLRPTIRGHVKEVRCLQQAPARSQPRVPSTAGCHRWAALRIVLAARSQHECACDRMIRPTKPACLQLLDGMQRASKPVDLHEAFSLPVAFKVGQSLFKELGQCQHEMLAS